MKVTIQFKNNSPAVVERMMGSVLTQNEVKTLRGGRNGFWYTTDVSPMLVLAAFEEDGFHFEDFESIAFYP